MTRTSAALAISLAAAAWGCTTPDPPSTPVAAITPTLSATSEDVPATITKLEQEWSTAIVNKDAIAIERLLASDFVGTTNDVRYTRDDAIVDVKTGTHEALTLDDLAVRVYGDTAITTFEQTEKSHHGKADFSGHYLFTNVWVKKDGAWHAVASHGARIR